MLRNILLVSVLICSACAMHLEYLKVDSDEDQLDEELIKAMVMSEAEIKFSPQCWACKWVVDKVREHLSNKANAQTIEQKLHRVCDKIGFIMKTKCKKMVTKYIGILTEELATNDDAQSICAKIKLCSPKEMIEFNQVNLKL